MSEVTPGSVKVETGVGLDLTTTDSVQRLERYWLEQMSKALMQGHDLAAQRFHKTSVTLRYLVRERNDLAEERDRLVKDYEELSQEMHLSGE